MSEVELHTMRQRLERGRLHKAQRGAMCHGVPMGYVLLATGAVDKDPDAQARAVMQLVFDQFDCLGSLSGLFHYPGAPPYLAAHTGSHGAAEGAVTMAAAVLSDLGPGAAPADLCRGVCLWTPPGRSRARVCRPPRPLSEVGPDGPMGRVDTGPPPCL